METQNEQLLNTVNLKIADLENEINSLKDKKINEKNRKKRISRLHKIFVTTLIASFALFGFNFFVTFYELLKISTLSVAIPLVSCILLSASIGGISEVKNNLEGYICEINSDIFTREKELEKLIKNKTLFMNKTNNLPSVEQKTTDKIEKKSNTNQEVAIYIPEGKKAKVKVKTKF